MVAAVAGLEPHTAPNAVQAETDLTVSNKVNAELGSFIRQLQEELVVGESTHLEIEGLHGDPVTFTIARQ